MCAWLDLCKERMHQHTSFRNVVHQLALLGDPGASREPLGLIPSRPLLRPADMITSAVSHGLVGLVVGVAAPGARVVQGI